MRLFLFLGMFALVFGQSLAEDKPCRGNYNDKYDIRYSKIKDSTTIKAKKFNQDDGRLQVVDEKGKAPSRHEDTFALSLDATYPGMTFVSGTKAQLKISFAHFELQGQAGTEGRDRENVYTAHQKCDKLALLIDGKQKEYPLEYNTRIDRDIMAVFHWEWLTVTLTEKQYMEIINATRVDGEICETAFVLTKDQICFLKDLLDRMKTGDPKAAPKK